jgi:hypothetical protein
MLNALLDMGLVKQTLQTAAKILFLAAKRITAKIDVPKFVLRAKERSCSKKF